MNTEIDDHSNWVMGIDVGYKGALVVVDPMRQIRHMSHWHITSRSQDERVKLSLLWNSLLPSLHSQVVGHIVFPSVYLHRGTRNFRSAMSLIKQVMYLWTRIENELKPNSFIMEYSDAEARKIMGIKRPTDPETGKRKGGSPTKEETHEKLRKVPMLSDLTPDALDAWVLASARSKELSGV